MRKIITIRFNGKTVTFSRDSNRVTIGRSCIPFGDCSDELSTAICKAISEIEEK